MTCRFGNPVCFRRRYEAFPAGRRKQHASRVLHPGVAVARGVILLHRPCESPPRPLTSPRPSSLMPDMESNQSPAARSNRLRGWVLIVVGPLLSLAMAGLWVYLWRTIHLSGQSGATARWTGSAQMTARTFQLFGTIFAFGLVCLATGIFQVKTGRRHAAFLVALLLLVGLIIFLGNQIMQLAP